MPRRLRIRKRLEYPYCPYGGWRHRPYPLPPPHWWGERRTREDEKEDLKEYVEMLREEIKDAEEQLKELETAA